MKKLFTFALLAVLIFTMLPLNVFAAEAKESDAGIIYLEDGSYITVEIISMDTRATNTKTGSKIYRYRNSDGEEQWSITLQGTFTYTGSSATCTASSASISIVNDNWYTVSKTVGKSGASAVGNVTMGKKWLGITVSEETVGMRLTCSASGTLS